MLKQNKIAVSEIKIIYEPKVKPSERYQITCSQDTYKLLLQSWDMNTIWLLEEFKLVTVNNRFRVLGIYPLSKGGIRKTYTDIRLIFMIALQIPTAAVILAHNHPSGELIPSASDKIFTEQVKAAGLIHQIVLSDHLIISPDGYYSFADNGLI